MESLSSWRAEEDRLVGYLKAIGFTTEAPADPHGWLFATNPIAQPVGFRAGPHFLCLYSDYPAGSRKAALYHDLLREVNRLNAVHWLVRCTLITHDPGANGDYSIRLQANIPLGMPADELGVCLFSWVRESTYIERTARFWAWTSEESASTEERRCDAIDAPGSKTT